MPKYRVKETSFIDNRVVQEGEIVEYTPPTHGSDGKKLAVATSVSENLEEIVEKSAAVDPAS